MSGGFGRCRAKRRRCQAPGQADPVGDLVRDLRERTVRDAGLARGFPDPPGKPRDQAERCLMQLEAPHFRRRQVGPEEVALVLVAVGEHDHDASLSPPPSATQTLIWPSAAFLASTGDESDTL